MGHIYIVPTKWFRQKDMVYQSDCPQQFEPLDQSKLSCQWWKVYVIESMEAVRRVQAFENYVRREFQKEAAERQMARGLKPRQKQDAGGLWPQEMSSTCPLLPRDSWPHTELSTLDR